MWVARTSWRIYVGASAFQVASICLLVAASVQHQFYSLQVASNPESNVRSASWQVGIFRSRVRLHFVDASSVSLPADGLAQSPANPEWRAAAVLLCVGLAASTASLAVHLCAFADASAYVKVVAVDAALSLAGLCSQLACLALAEAGSSGLAQNPAERLDAAVTSAFARSDASLKSETTPNSLASGPAFWTLVWATAAQVAAVLGVIPWAMLLAGRHQAELEPAAGPVERVVESGNCYPIRCVTAASQ